MEQENRQENLKQERLESVIVALSPTGFVMSKIPLVGDFYLSVLEKRYQKLFPEYQNQEFVFK